MDFNAILQQIGLNKQQTGSYFNKPEQAGEPKPMPTPLPTPTPTPIPQEALATADELNAILPVTREYGVPDKVAAGQWAAEGRGKHKYGQAPYNNPFNINAIDSNPDAAFQYESPEAGAQAYGEMMQRKYAEALEQEKMLDILLKIQEMGYAGDPATYDKRADNNYDSYSAFIQDTPEWKVIQ